MFWPGEGNNAAARRQSKSRERGLGSLKSARGLAQSKTLARIFWRLGKREASWSAVASTAFPRVQCNEDFDFMIDEQGSAGADAACGD